MTKFKRIGGFFRDPIHPPPPLDAIVALCERYGASFIDVSSSREVNQPVDLILAFGGDGTVLRALERFTDVPVLAVNSEA